MRIEIETTVDRELGDYTLTKNVEVVGDVTMNADESEYLVKLESVEGDLTYADITIEEERALEDELMFAYQKQQAGPEQDLQETIKRAKEAVARLEKAALQ